MSTIIRLSDLQKALRRTLPAVSDDQARRALQCVHFSSTANQTRIESADGFRLVIVTLPYGDTRLYGTSASLECLIDGESLEDVLKIKDNRKEPRYITLDYTPDGLRLNDALYPGVDERYPDLNIIVPLTERAWFTGTLPADFGQGADIMVAFGKHTASTVTYWTPSNAGHVLQASDEEFGTTRYDMTAQVACHKYPRRTYGINSKFLKGMCDAAGNDAVTFALGAPNGPMRFDFDNAIMVIMPMHISSENDVTPFDWQAETPATDETPIYNPPAYDYCAEVRNNAYCHLSPENDNLQPASFAWTNNAFQPAVPQVGAVECEIEYLDAKFSTPTYGKGFPYVTVKFNVLRPVPSYAFPLHATKSELMTALNIQRANIRRTYKYHPCEMFEHLKALYCAFGRAQRRTPAPFRPSALEAQALADLEELIRTRRAAHDITPLVTGNVSAPCPTAQTSIIA